MTFDLNNHVATLLRDGTSDVVDATRGPVRVDGMTVGAPHVTENAPHRGEMHPDGDELLYLVTGRIEVIIEDDGTQEVVGTERVVSMQPGDALVVPKGLWHRIDVLEPSHLVHVTPGPGSGHRPL